jgi:uridine kinase
VFVDVPEETRFRRRLQRDARERLRTSESVLTQFESSVKPMHDAFVEPSRVHADIIVTKGGANLQARAQIVLRIRELAFRKGPRHTHR